MAANRGPAALQSLGLEQRDPPLSTPETLPTQHNLTPSTAGTKEKGRWTRLWRHIQDLASPTAERGKISAG